jgi:hypothetical protein
MGESSRISNGKVRDEKRLISVLFERFSVVRATGGQSVSEPPLFLTFRNNIHSGALTLTPSSPVGG